MDSGRVANEIWRFGDVEFDEAQDKLKVDGRAVGLDRNSREILSILLRNAGDEVSKEQLLEAGWPDRIVHENSLAKAIGRLRNALGGSGSALKAVYGRGYRLAVELELAPPPEREAAPIIATAIDAVSEAEPSVRTPRPRRVLIAAAALLGLAGLLGAFFWNRSQPVPDDQFREAPPIIADAPDAIGRVLWVDDHPQNNIYEQRFFEDRRIAVHSVRSSPDAFRLLAMYDYDVVISDMGRGEDRLAGIRLAEQMRARGIATPLVVYTVRPDEEQQQQAQRSLVAEAGAQGLAVTPQEVRALILRYFGNPAPRPR